MESKDVFSYKKAYGDVFGAKGDVFRAKGDVFSAKGDVFGAKGDVFKAKGDVFNKGIGDLESPNRISTDVPDSNAETLSNTADKKGVFYYLEKTLGIADQVVDIKNKWEGGTHVDDSMVSYDIKPGYEEKKDNTIWIIGGVLVALVVTIGVVSYMKKKK